MEKTFDPQSIEARVNEAWAKSGAFRAGAKGRENAEPFTIVIPPPNVTGSLHMGHALNNTLQDILCRYWRMKGKDVLWQPGTDHAGIATQMVVERKLAAEGKPDRRTMGREAFLKEVWDWKAHSGGTIVNQLKRLGASCDWDRERFTMDEGLSKAVIAFFVALNDQGLLYKDKRLVNWDPKLLTAISDLEVEQREVKGSYAWVRPSRSPDEQGPEGTGQEKDANPKPFDVAALGKILDREPGGHLYYFDYPIEGETYDAANPATFITVATTRPETMLGDTAVAVHPADERFRHLIGKASYGEKPARLRMNRIVKPLGSKADFELFSLAVSAINGCESCLRAHEQAVLHGGLTEEHVHDAVRIAATMQAAAVSLELPPLEAPAQS